MKTPEYVRCPRCELNYIHKKDKYCEVCKKEMQVGGGEDFADMDLELCPICKTNYIQPDEVMCATCLAEKNASGKTDDHGEWEDYLQRDEDDLDDGNEEIGDMSSIKSYDDDDDLLDTDLDMPDDSLDFGDAFDDDDEDDDEEEEDDDDSLDDDLDDIDIDDDDEDDYDDDDE